jgi:hypothetical protein
MKSTKINQQKSIRFRRWSRKGYAVFCSLTCVVTIGCVSISISDKSLQKISSSYSNSICLNEKESPDKLKEQADLEILVQQFHEMELVERKFESTTACVLNKIFFNQNG